MNLDALLDNLLTSGIRLSDPERTRKFKAANVFQLVFIMTAPLLGILFFYIGAIQLFYVVIIAGLLMVSSLLLLRVTKNLMLGGHYAIFILWCTLLIISWHTGAVSFEGVIKPAFVLNAGLILLAVFLMGYSGGAIWTTVVCMESGLLVYLFRTGYPFPDLIPPDIAPVISLGAFWVALMSILLFAFLFEKEKSDALLRAENQPEALSESKRYIDDILKKSPIPIFMLDRNHRVIQWNLALEKLTGICAEEILGKEAWEGLRIDEWGSIADMIIDDPDKITEVCGDSVLSGTETGWFELKMFFPKLKEGTRAIVTAAPILDNSGTVRGAIQTIQEIGTDGVLGQVDEAFASPVFKVDSQGKITYWNHACEKDFGYTSFQVIGKSVFTFVSKQYGPLLKETIMRVLKGESFTDKDLKYYTNEGKPVYVLAKAYPLQGADEQSTECVIVNTNITDLRLKMKKLELYASENKDKLKSLSEECDLLKKNLATFTRKKDEPQQNS